MGDCCCEGGGDFFTALEGICRLLRGAMIVMLIDNGLAPARVFSVREKGGRAFLYQGRWDERVSIGLPRLLIC